MKAIDDRQQKRRGFSAAGCCCGNQIVAVHNHRYCGGLDWGRSLMASSAHRLQDCGGQGQFRKRQENSIFRASGFKLGDEPNERF
jgi:hypothetical protein